MAIVLYARKSVERENSISCETQLEYCKSMLKPHERDEKVITFVDNGFSGGNVEREGFQKMMKLVRQGKVNKVIVYKLDRISRSLADFVNILHEFKAHGVEFVSSQESFDTSSPYGELVVKILMVFAEFERTSIINRITQAYAHRSELGFYMGGRQPYGFELQPTVIHNVKTKKLNPIPSQVEQIRYMYEVYAQEDVSLRRLLDLMVFEGKTPLNGTSWSTSKISAILKNPIYVQANSDVYEFYERKGTNIITDVSQFTGEYGAQLYGISKHDTDNSDWSDVKLVLLTHKGIVPADIWLKCQRKLEQNKQVGGSLSNTTSWLAGKVICEMCGHTMTTVKGKPNQEGQIRRYFNCTGKSHKRSCKGPRHSIYADDLECMVYDCITEKLTQLRQDNRKKRTVDSAEVNDLKLKLKGVEQSEKQLMDSLLSGALNEDLIKLANAKATQLKQDRLALQQRLDDLASKSDDMGVVVDLARSWKNANFTRKKEVAMLLIHRISITQDGTARILWNI